MTPPMLPKTIMQGQQISAHFLSFFITRYKKIGKKGEIMTPKAILTTIVRQVAANIPPTSKGNTRIINTMHRHESRQPEFRMFPKQKISRLAYVQE